MLRVRHNIQTGKKYIYIPAGTKYVDRKYGNKNFHKLSLSFIKYTEAMRSDKFMNGEFQAISPNLISKPATGDRTCSSPHEAQHLPTNDRTCLHRIWAQQMPGSNRECLNGIRPSIYQRTTEYACTVSGTVVTNRERACLHGIRHSSYQQAAEYAFTILGTLVTREQKNMLAQYQ